MAGGAAHRLDARAQRAVLGHRLGHKHGPRGEGEGEGEGSTLFYSNSKPNKPSFLSPLLSSKPRRLVVPSPLLPTTAPSPGAVPRRCASHLVSSRLVCPGDAHGQRAQRGLDAGLECRGARAQPGAGHHLRHRRAVPTMNGMTACEPHSHHRIGRAYLRWCHHRIGRAYDSMHVPPPLLLAVRGIM